MDGQSVSCRASPPPAGITQMSFVPPRRFDVNETCFPSGDHWGSPSYVGLAVNTVIAPPATGTDQMSWLPPRFEVNNAVRPSGERVRSARP